MINFVANRCWSQSASPTPSSSSNISSPCNRALEMILIISEIALISLSVYAVLFASGMSIALKNTLISLTGVVALVDLAMAARHINNTCLSTSHPPDTNQTLVSRMRSLFGVEHKNIKPEGVFYKIKNTSSETVGYLFGTLHVWDLHWESLRDEVNVKVDKSTEVYFEIDMKTLPLRAASVDLEVWDLAQNKKNHFLETLEEQLQALNPYLQIIQANPDKSASSQEILKAWQDGDEKKMESLFQQEHDLFVSLNQTRVFHSLFANRNKSWFDQQLNKQLQSASKANKFFVCVGVNHYFDVESNGEVSPGLKTLFQQAGYHLVKI